jgi:hypothetical protein
MNPTALVLLLLGGAAAVAVAAASSSPSTTDEPKPSDDDLLSSAERMVLLFDLYTAQNLSQLDDDELWTLAQLNTEAKGLPLIDREGVISVARAVVPSQPLAGIGQVQGISIPGALKTYRMYFFLPPGAAMAGDVPIVTKEYLKRPIPDIYSVWAGETRLVCNDGGFGDACHDGYYEDWFGRIYGTFKDETSDFDAISKGILKDLKVVWQNAGPELLKYIAQMASNYPGIGTVVATGVTFLASVGQGMSVENAALAGARAAVPSALRSVYDIGVGLAVNGSLDVKAALTVAMAAAISQGVISGDVLEKYNTIKAAYESAKATGETIEGGLGSLSTAVNVGT